MESRFAGGVVAVSLLIVAFGLVLWLIRLSRRLPAEYRPPFGLASPFELLRLDYYTANGRTSIAKAACALALLSFVIVVLGFLASKFPPPVARPGTPALPPGIFFFAASAMFAIGSLLAGLVLMLAAALQFGWATMRPSAKALRLNAARYALYSVGAFLVAAGHLVLTKLGSDLLK